MNLNFKKLATTVILGAIALGIGIGIFLMWVL